MSPEPKNIKENSEHHQDIDLRGIYTENKVNQDKPKKTKKVFFWLKIILIIFSTGLVASTVFSSKSFSDNMAGAPGFTWLSNSFVGQISHLAQSETHKLKGEERGRVNVLLTGIGGENHDGGQLADTIMLLSIDTTNKKVSMISIPRDLTVPIEGYGWRKINSINAFAEKDNPGTGAQVFASTFAKLFDQPIDYYVRADFVGFSQFIDDLGGIDVNVEHQLDDYAYPILGQEDNPNYYARYQHLHVETGLQHMDGSLALKFARSRHGLKGEGSDFARARRQQLVIEAVKAKLKVGNILLNPSLVTKSIQNYQEHLNTNLQAWELLRLWSLIKEVNKDQIVNKVIDDSADNLLRASRGTDGAYILLPKAGDFSEIQAMMANVFASATPNSDKNEIVAEAPTIIIENGTHITGLAAKAGNSLALDGFRLIDTTNAKQKNFTTSIIYSLGSTSKPASLEFLKLKTGASVGAEMPGWLAKELETNASYIADYEKPDFVLILGSDFSLNKSSSLSAPASNR